jgi:hypothetical protein
MIRFLYNSLCTVISFALAFVFQNTVAQTTEKNILGHPVINPGGCKLTGIGTVEADNTGRHDSAVYRYNNDKLISSVAVNSITGLTLKDTLLYSAGSTRPFRIITREDGEVLHCIFNYDSSNRVKQIDFTGTSFFSKIYFTYNGDKNITCTVYNQMNQPYLKCLYEFDNNYNLKQTSFDLIENGRQIHVGEIRYQYDLAVRNPFLALGDYRFLPMVYYFNVKGVMIEGGTMVLGNNVCIQSAYNYTYKGESISGTLNSFFSNVTSNGFPAALCVQNYSGPCGVKYFFSYSCK